MGKAKRLINLKQQKEIFEAYLKELEANKKNNAFTLKCVNECVDDNILPLIVDANTTKEYWDTLERSFGVRGSIQVEYEGGYIVSVSTVR